MAEVNTDGGGKKKGGKVRSKKMSTKIDFTPMVDLGFLLITFFMLTTTLAKPSIMPIVMPEKDVPIDEVEKTKESQVLTLILGAKDKVYWYEGINDAKLDSCDYSATGLRKVILDKKDRVKTQWSETEKEIEKKDPETGEVKIEKKMVSKLNVIIKPTRDARYKNVVDAFDEMKICNVGLYVMLDISKQEEDFLKNPAAGLKFSVEEQVAAAAGNKK